MRRRLERCVKGDAHGHSRNFIDRTMRAKCATTIARLLGQANQHVWHLHDLRAWRPGQRGPGQASHCHPGPSRPRRHGWRTPAPIQIASSGRAKLLAIAAPSRSPFQPNLPTFSEQGVSDVDVINFLGWYAPGGVTPEAVAALHGAIAESLKQASVLALFNAQAQSAESSTPRELTAMVKGAYDAWGKLVRRVGIPKQ